MIATAETIQTPDGPFTLVIDDDDAVLASGWSADVDAVLARLAPRMRPTTTRRASAAQREGVTEAGRVVVDYYAGDLLAPGRVPVRHVGTELQVAGWAALREIAPGAPLTYTQLAARIGRPRAVRAAAGICARNAPALFVPCHRVVSTGGGLGGFAWGLGVKRSLLEREHAGAAGATGATGATGAAGATDVAGVRARPTRRGALPLAEAGGRKLST